MKTGDILRLTRSIDLVDSQNDPRIPLTPPRKEGTGSKFGCFDSVDRTCGQGLEAPSLLPVSQCQPEMKTGNILTTVSTKGDGREYFKYFGVTFRFRRRLTTLSSFFLSCLPPSLPLPSLPTKSDLGRMHWLTPMARVFFQPSALCIRS